MGAIADLWKSERGLAFVIALTIATVAWIGLGKMTTDQWADYTKWLIGIYVVGKSATSLVETIVRGKTEASASSPAPAPAATKV